MPFHVKELFSEEATKDKGHTWLQDLIDFQEKTTTNSAKDSRNNPLEIKFKYAFSFLIKYLREHKCL